MRGTVRFQEIFKQYHERVHFLNIYIREAHPKDGWWLGRRLTRKPMRLLAPLVSMEPYDPQTIEERRSLTGDCLQALQTDLPTLVDEMDDRVSKAYAAWPTRLYLVGLDGRVVYAGGMGPLNYHPTELAEAIDTYLARLEHSDHVV